MVGALGDDVYAGMTVDNLIAQGVDAAHVARVSRFERRRADLGRARRDEPDHRRRRRERRCRSGRSRGCRAIARRRRRGGRPARDSAGRDGGRFEAAREVGAATILNPAPAATLDADLLDGADWLIPNETEFAILAGLDRFDASDDAALLAFARGVRPRLVVTLGSRGVALVTEAGAVARVPAVPVEAVDTTGAGDAFVGAFAYGLAAGLPELTAVRLGIACASDSVTKHGTQSSFATREGARHILGRVLATGRS